MTAGEAMSPAEIAAALAATLRHEAVVLPGAMTAAEAAAFLGVAFEHGVGGLLWLAARDRGDLYAHWPVELLRMLDDRVRRDSALEAFRRRELREITRALHHVGVGSILLKGAGLAYTVYPAPYLRPRNDTDLLVRREDLATSVRVLESLGYARHNSVGREVVHAQWTFERSIGALRHVVDLHWAVSNRPLFARMLSFDELAAEAVEIEALGGAWTLSPVHALLFACIHRVAHHEDSPLLIWLYDLKLLAARFGPAEWDRFFGLASEKRLVAVCVETFELSAQQVGFPLGVLERARSLRAHIRRPEPSAAYLGGTGGSARSLLFDLRATPGLRAKLRLLAGHAFPDPDYMRREHGAAGTWRLCGLYLMRAVRGVLRTLDSVEP